MPVIVPLVVACGILAVAWAVGRAVAAHRLETGLCRIGPTSRSTEAVSIQALLDRLGVVVLSGRAGAAFGRWITATHPSVSPSLGAAVALVAGLAGALIPVMLGHLDAAPLGAPLGLALAGMLVRRREAQHTDAVERQLPDVLLLQAGAIRAGHSVASSLGTTGRECGPPLGPELVRSAAALDLGTPLEDVLAELARRSGTGAVQPWIAALLAGRSTGGDISRTLTSLAARARERAQLQSELRALTAQGRLSGTVVALAPAAFVVLTAASSRREAQALYGTRAGIAVLAAGALLDVAGLAWIRRIAGVRA